MNAIEMGELLAFAALYDNRKVGDPDVVAWLEAIGDLPYLDARSAVAAHYGSESTERIMPGHIRQRVRTARAERVRDTETPPPPPELLRNPRAYCAALRAAETAIADGRDPQAAMQAIARTARPELEAS